MAPRKKKSINPNEERGLVVYVPPVARGDKTSKEEIERRVNVVMNELLRGSSDRLVVQSCHNQWGVCAQTAKSYIRKAMDKANQLMEIDAKFILRKNINILTETAEFSNTIGQPGCAVAAIKEINRMVGIGPETITASDKFGNSITFNLNRRHDVGISDGVQKTAPAPASEGDEDLSDIVMDLIPL